MAAYDQNTDFVSDCVKKMLNLNNVTDRELMQDLLTIINTEFTAIKAVQSTYTLQVSALSAAKALTLLSNSFRVEAMQLIIEDLWSELALVVTNGNSYTKTVYVKYESGVTDFIDGIIPKMKRRVEGFPNTTTKILLYELIDLIDTELDAMEASDGDT
jgi:hypothetical protein